jgi:hypothetical protein
MKKSLRALYNADRLIGLVFIVAGVSGFLHTLLGEWRTGPGFGAKLFPQVTFVLMAACGVLLILSAKAGGYRSLLNGAEVKSLALLLGSGFLYFQAVLRVGLVVSTFLYVSALFAVLTPSPVRNWKLVVVPGLIATASIWAMFSTLIKLVLPRTLLF